MVLPRKWKFWWLVQLIPLLPPASEVKVIESIPSVHSHGRTVWQTVPVLSLHSQYFSILRCGTLGCGKHTWQQMMNFGEKDCGIYDKGGAWTLGHFHCLHSNAIVILVHDTCIMSQAMKLCYFSLPCTFHLEDLLPSPTFTCLFCILRQFILVLLSPGREAEIKCFCAMTSLVR